MAGTVKKLQFSEGTDVGAPSDLSLATSTTTIEAYADDAAYVTANGAAMAGSVYVNTTSRTFKVYANGAWRQCWVEQDPADATKLIVKDLSGQSTGVTLTIASVATANRTATFPDASITVAGRANTETLSNKTLASPLISGGSVDVAAAGNLAVGASIGANNLTLGGSTTTTVIPGNLQVQGTTTQVDTTNMNVKDQNILINDGGNDASAEGAGLTVERTGTNGSVAYEDALASKFKVGALGSESEVVTVDDVQTIENKRVRLDTTPAANDTTSPRLVLPSASLATLQGISGGNHPAEGAVYWATDVNKAYMWDGSTLRPMGSGSGSGSGDVNYISLAEKSSDFEADASGWNTYDDGAVAAPVNGTGGSPTVITAVRNTTTPLNGTGDLKISKSAADGQGEGVSIDIPVPRGYQAGQKAQVAFLLDTLHASFVSGDIKVYVYDVDNASFLNTSMVNLPSAYLGRFAVYFDATTSANYRLILHTATTNASAYDIYIDDVIFGAVTKEAISSSKISRWEDYTPTISAGAVIASSKFRWRQVGESVEIDGTMVFGPGSTGSGELSFPIPNNWSIDTVTYPHGGGTALGVCEVYQTGRFYGGIVSYTGNPGDGVLYFLNGYAAGTTGGNEVRRINTGDLNAGDFVTFSARVQVAELVGLGTLYEGTTDIEYAFNEDLADANAFTTFRHGPRGTMFGNFTTSRTKRIEFISPVANDDFIQFQVSQDSGATWQDLSCNGVVFQWEVQNTVTYGVSLQPVIGDLYHYDVVFGDYRAASAATYGGAGASWSNIDNDPQYLWRVAKVKKGVALGFAEATSTSTGLAGPASADFIPGIVGSAGVDAVSNVAFKYARVGKIVTCTMYCDIDANAAGAAYIDFQTPIDSNFTAATDAIGVAVNLFDQHVGIIGAPAPNTIRMSFTALVLTATTWMMSFQYEIKS